MNVRGKFLPYLVSSHSQLLILGLNMKLYIVSIIRQTMNTKLFFTAIAIAAIFSIALTAVTTNVSGQNMSDGNMTGGNMTMSADGNMTSMGNNLTVEMDDKYTAGG